MRTKNMDELIANLRDCLGGDKMVRIDVEDLEAVLNEIERLEAQLTETMVRLRLDPQDVK